MTVSGLSEQWKTNESSYFCSAESSVLSGITMYDPSGFFRPFHYGFVAYTSTFVNDFSDTSSHSAL